MPQKKSLFKRLTRLFRTNNPNINKKIRSQDTTVAGPNKYKSSGMMLFQRTQASTYAGITGTAYNIAERMMRYQDFQQMEDTPEIASALDLYCLTSDCVIHTTEGDFTIEQLLEQQGSYDKSSGKRFEFNVYCYDEVRKCLTVGTAHSVRQTGTQAKIVKVVLDSGKEIKCTAGHRFMTRSGEWVEASKLSIGTSLMPFKVRMVGSTLKLVYTMDKNKTKNGWQAQHVFNAENLIREMRKGEVVHHKNLNTLDNRIENLEIVDSDTRDYLRGKISLVSLENKVIKNLKINEDNEQILSLTRENVVAAYAAGDLIDDLAGRLKVTPNVLQRFIRTKLGVTWKDFVMSRGVLSNHKKKPRRENDSVITYQQICDIVRPGEQIKIKELADKLDVTVGVVGKRLKDAGFNSYYEWQEQFQNCKVVSVEDCGVADVYDITTDVHHNFACNGVIVHNSEEAVAADEKGRSLHVYSDNEKIKEELENLFYNVMNIEFNIRPWARNMVKYGDLFLLIDVHPEHGVVNTIPIPVNELEREENYDKDNPFAVRFRWQSMGNRTLENWEVAHIRLLGNDLFLPYGSSVLEQARRIWRQLVLMEDAMLVYRVVRAPERRVFYIDVANVPPDDIATYVEQQRKNLRTNSVVDRSSGKVDLRYAPLSVEDDYFIAVRGNETATKIETLAGGQNVASVEDVRYLQSKMFAALKIPKAYLGFDEALASKSSLAQLDIRFSRTISVIQKTLIAEFNKIAIIHLFALGYDDEDLKNFTIRLSNPSTVAQQQKLELWRAKFEIAGAALGIENFSSTEFLRKEILGLNDAECRAIDEQRKRETAFNAKLTPSEEGASGGGGGGGGGSLFGGDGGASGGGGELDVDLGDTGGGDSGATEEPAEEPEDLETSGDEPEEEEKPKLELLTSSDDATDDTVVPLKLTEKEKTMPVKVGSLKHALYNRSRRRTHGPEKTHMPDYNRMLSHKQNNDPYDREFLSAAVSNPLGEVKIPMSPDLVSALKGLRKRMGMPASKSKILAEIKKLENVQLEEIEIDDKEL